MRVPALAAILGGLAGLAAAAASEPAADPRPNIVVIVADDLDAESIASLPRLQSRLVRAGVSFPSAYVSSPLCAPSRAALLTGRYPHNTGLVSNNAPLGGFSVFHREGLEKDTIATRLKAAGYRTAYVGKYMNEYPRGADGGYVPPGWDFWAATQGDAPYFDFIMNIDGVQRHFETKPAYYSTDVIRDQALEFIRCQGEARSRVPYFLYVAPIAPHFPSVAAYRHRGALLGAKVPRVPSFDEEDIADKPAWIRGKARLDAEATRSVDKLYRLRGETMLAVDEMIEDLVRTLEETGELSRTFIFFTSDNGYELGHHRQTRGKGYMYEESVRIPLLVRGPGVPAGKTRPHLVGHLDLFPTWLELAKAPEAKDAGDGRSIAALFGEAPLDVSKWRKDLLIEFRAGDGKEAPPFFALRTPEWSYAEYPEGERELYDMRADPYQLENRAGTASEVVKKLSARVQTLKACAGNCW
jgi:arylsulfatase A-like enzyme